MERKNDSDKKETHTKKERFLENLIIPVIEVEVIKLNMGCLD